MQLPLMGRNFNVEVPPHHTQNRTSVCNQPALGATPTLTPRTLVPNRMHLTPTAHSTTHAHTPSLLRVRSRCMPARTPSNTHRRTPMHAHVHICPHSRNHALSTTHSQASTRVHRHTRAGARAGAHLYSHPHARARASPTRATRSRNPFGPFDALTYHPKFLTTATPKKPIPPQPSLQAPPLPAANSNHHLNLASWTTRSCDGVQKSACSRGRVTGCVTVSKERLLGSPALCAETKSRHDSAQESPLTWYRISVKIIGSTQRSDYHVGRWHRTFAFGVPVKIGP